MDLVISSPNLFKVPYGEKSILDIWLLANINFFLDFFNNLKTFPIIKILFIKKL